MSTAPQIVPVDRVPTAVIAGVIPMTELVAFFDRAFAALGPALAQQGRVPTGAAFARYRGRPSDTVDLEVGFPVDAPVEPAGDVTPSELPAGRVAQVVHAGSFDGLSDAWQGLGAWIGEQGETPTDDFWETYLTEPSPDMDPADLRTELRWLLA